MTKLCHFLKKAQNVRMDLRGTCMSNSGYPAGSSMFWGPIFMQIFFYYTNIEWITASDVRSVWDWLTFQADNSLKHEEIVNIFSPLLHGITLVAKLGRNRLQSGQKSIKQIKVNSRSESISELENFAFICLIHFYKRCASS